MIKFLVPNEVCEYCTLIEAVDWITYKWYPMEKWEENEERFFEGSCAQSLVDEYEDPEETELDKEMSLFLEGNKDKDGFDSDKYKDLRERKSKETKEIQEKAEFVYDSDTEISKHNLFIALREGKISAYGIFYDKIKKDYTSSDWNNDKAWNSIHENDDIEDDYIEEVRDLYHESRFLNEEEVQKIPASYWRFEGITWNKGAMRCPEGRYFFIHFNFNDLISVFEEDKPEYVTVEKRGNLLFYNDELGEITTPKKLGRKTIINWDLVHPYITSQIITSRGKLSKQDSFAQDIQDWIASKFQKQVGLSTIKEKLKPYYQHFQK